MGAGKARAGIPPHQPPPTGKFQARHLAREVTRIGRADDSDVVIDDLMVSRNHAELRSRPGGGFELIDLGSTSGTYLNGTPVTHAAVLDYDLIGLGHSEFRLVDGRLEEYLDLGGVPVEARDLTVVGRQGRVLVDDVSFSLAEGSMTAIAGPSGAGKSTLLAAVSGQHPAEQGIVLYGCRDLYVDYDELRLRIGVVPQDDVLHRELTLRKALEYAGRLRFPRDVTPEQRIERVDEVLDQLDLAHRSTSPIGQLSGGERKRTNVAVELLTHPSLLLLDEPLSGLDPGRARVLMRLLRRLADGGLEVVVVTHDVSSLPFCDQVIMLAPGGVPAYIGPPEGVTARFGETDLADVFTDLATHAPDRWRVQKPAVLDATTSHGAERAPLPTPPTSAPTQRRTSVPASLRRWSSQVATLTTRYLDVLASDRRNAALLLLQAPVLGLLVLAALPAGELGPPPLSEVRLVSAAGIVLFVILVGATWLGANNAIREIARELPMLRRDRAAGLSLSAYVTSKALVLGILTVGQAVVLVALATARQQGPSDAVVLGWPTGELMVVVAMAGLAAMALALFVSAVAGSAERATSILPVVLILQLVLGAGVVLPEIVDKPVLRELSLVSSTQWGIAGAASTVDLNELQLFDDRLRDLRTVDANDPEPAVEALAANPQPNGRWAHTRLAWVQSVLALGGMTIVALLATTLALRRYDPGRA